MGKTFKHGLSYQVANTMSIRSTSSRLAGNQTFLVEDMMDYAESDMGGAGGTAGGGATAGEQATWNAEAPHDEAVMFDTEDLYDGFFGPGGTGQNFSELFSIEDLGSHLVLGGEVSGLMVSYMKQRPYVLGSLLVLTTIIGVCANVTLLVLLLKRGWEGLTFTSILLLNLALACLLFLLGGMPLLLVENVFGYGWQLGTAVCQVHRYLIYVSFFSIGYAVVAVLFHQTLALYAPDRMSGVDSSPWCAICACGLLWLVILLANVPNYLGHSVTEEIAGISYCFNKEVRDDPAQMRAWTLIHFVFSFALPFVLLCACSFATLFRLCTGPHAEYNRLRDAPAERRDYTTLAIAVTIAFALCWAPDKIFSLMLVLSPRQMDAPLLIASDVMMVLGYTNPALNPFIILLSGLREVKSGAGGGATTVPASIKRTIAEHVTGKQDSSTSLPLCAQEEVVDPEMITTV